MVTHLDADIIIDFLRRNSTTRLWFQTLTQLPYVSCIARDQVYEGCKNKIEQKEAQFFFKELGEEKIVYPSKEVIESASQLILEVNLKNRLGANDAYIAEIAKSHNAILYTLNEKHFRVVPGLNYEIPYQKYSQEQTLTSSHS